MFLNGYLFGIYLVPKSKLVFLSPPCCVQATDYQRQVRTKRKFVSVTPCDLACDSKKTLWAESLLTAKPTCCGVRVIALSCMESFRIQQNENSLTHTFQVSKSHGHAQESHQTQVPSLSASQQLEVFCDNSELYGLVAALLDHEWG